MSTVDDNGLASIKSLLVEKDSTNSARYWIWMKIQSRLRTVVRLDASIVDGIVAYPEPDGGNGNHGERSHFMGRHKLEIGENELPALPLTFNKEMARRNVVIKFGMKSRRHPEVCHRKFQIIGPGLFITP